MLFAQVTGDVVTAIGNDIPGVKIEPKDEGFVQSTPITRLRYANKQFQDAARYHVFYVDENGLRHISPGNGRTKVEGDFDDFLTMDNKKPRMISKSEMANRRGVNGLRFTKFDAPRLALALDRANRDPKFAIEWTKTDGKKVKLNATKIRELADAALDKGLI